MAKILDRDNLSAEIIPRAKHTISREIISKSALKVLYRLDKAGYQAYLVGGSVRDILLGIVPKDFDVVTNAKPEEIRKLFSNSIIIGKRFRLVHVRYGHDIVEVATFRGEYVSQNGERGEAPSKILRDNAYGDLEDDVLRRDFTINALYYNIADFSVVDYVHGMQDLESKTIRIMGDPVRRYTEDPVRMLRGIRLSAKLNLSIEEKTGDAIILMKDLIEHVPSARLFDEITKMSLCGYVSRVYELLSKYEVFGKLFPSTDATIKKDSTGFTQTLLQTALKETDNRIATGKTINPAFLIAVFFWIPLQDNIKKHLREGMKLYPALARAESEIVKSFAPLVIPKRLVAIVRDIWRLQYHMTQTKRIRIFRSFYHPRFRAAYDFMLIRLQAGEKLKDLCAFWTEFQDANHDDQERMIRQRQVVKPHLDIKAMETNEDE